jgi:hypothetical protein
MTARPQKPEIDPETRITVCDACFRACCWQGQFMCDDARDAGTTVRTVRELRDGNHGEHEDYWR